MAGLHAVKTLKDHVVVPGHGLVDVAQTTVQIAQTDFDTIPAGAFSGGSPSLQDMGAIPDPTDEVSNQAAFVAQPAALVTTQTAGATYVTGTTDTMINNLKADVTALQGKLTALMTALKVANGPMASS